jgi:hypothetical protein
MRFLIQGDASRLVSIAGFRERHMTDIALSSAHHLFSFTA